MKQSFTSQFSDFNQIQKNDLGIIKYKDHFIFCSQLKSENIWFIFLFFCFLKITNENISGVRTV